ncbi:hypothetical protein BC829DRAFT_486218, partial [Chytridium lagenaria]
MECSWPACGFNNNCCCCCFFYNRQCFIGDDSNPSHPHQLHLILLPFSLPHLHRQPVYYALDILATACLIAHLRITQKGNRPSLVSMPAFSLILISTFTTCIVQIFIDTNSISIPLLIARIFRLGVLAYAVQLAWSVGDGLRKDPREERYGESDGKAWGHADVAWGVLLASIGGSYWENNAGFLSSMLIFTLYLQTLCFTPQIFLLISYAKEEPRLYRPTRFHGLMLPPTPPPNVAVTLPIAMSIYLLRCILDFGFSLHSAGTIQQMAAGEIASLAIRIAILLVCVICITCARLRVGIWRLRSRRSRHGDDSTLEFLLDPDERIDGYDEYDDVIREGLDWGIDGTVESLPAYVAPPANPNIYPKSPELSAADTLASVSVPSRNLPSSRLAVSHTSNERDAVLPWDVEEGEEFEDFFEKPAPVLPAGDEH